MRKSILTVSLLGLLICPAARADTTGAIPAPGQRAPTAAQGVDLPLVSPASATVPPAGFSSTAQQAVAAAKQNPTIVALHRRVHPLFVQPQVWGADHWVVSFSRGSDQLAEVDLDRAARVTAVWTGALAAAPYARGHYAPLFDSWWVVVPFSVLFLVPFIDPRRLRRLPHLDALVLLSFLISYYLFNRADLEPAVWMAYPPLVYLLLRMVLIGLRRARRGVELPPLLPLRVLTIGLVVLIGARIGLSLADSHVTDVGYASVIGAHRIAHGQSLYFASVAHGDTYGPIAYLAYVPFEWLLPWRGVWDYVASAHAASIVFDLVTIAGLVVIGRRLAPGLHGRRLGLALGWAWAACPFTLLGLLMHTNDGLIAMLAVLSLVAFASPPARGALLGLAAAAKFSPAALLPLYASHRDRGIKSRILCVAAFALVVVASVVPFLPVGGLGEFYDHTLGYQLSRADVFSPWALHPALAPLKIVLAGAALVMATAVAFVPRKATLVQVCALAAAITIAVQLPAVHWFYYYVIWFMPFALVAILARDQVVETIGDRPALDADTARHVGARADPRVLIGA